MRPRLRRPEFSIDGRPAEGRYLLGAACNTRHVGSGMCLAPGARLDDGLLDLVLIQHAFRPRLARLLTQVFSGAHAGSPLVEERRAARFELELGPDEELLLDGELYSTDRARVDVLPAALELLGGDPDPAGLGRA